MVLPVPSGSRQRKGREQNSRPKASDCYGNLAARLLVALAYLAPVDDVPEGADILGTAVLVLQVVGVLPHVEAQHGLVAVHERAVLVGGAVHLELAVTLDDEPGPAGAEAGLGCLLELLLEGVEGAEGFADGGGQLAAGFAAPVRAHDLPEEVVVGETATVVAHGVGQGVGTAGEDLLDRLALHVGAAYGVVEVVGVGLVVLAVVELHRLLIDVRFQSVARVRQVGKFECHSCTSCENCFQWDLSLGFTVTKVTGATVSQANLCGGVRDRGRRAGPARPFAGRGWRAPRRKAPARSAAAARCAPARASPR